MKKEENKQPLPLWIEMTPTVLICSFLLLFGTAFIFSYLNVEKENKLLRNNNFIITPGKMTSLVVDNTELLTFMNNKNLKNITINKINNNYAFLANQMIDDKPTIYFADHIIFKDFLKEPNISQHVQTYVLKNIQN